MATYYPKWSESTWGQIASGSWVSGGYVETASNTYALTVTGLPRDPAWDPEPIPPPPPPDCYPISESDWNTVKNGTLDAHDPTKIWKDTNAYKVKAVDDGTKRAVVESA